MVLPAALAAAAVAQTFIVDVNSGPGTNFTSIAAAVAAVPDGAVLEVRPGTYAAFTIQNKSLTVFGQAGVQVAERYTEIYCSLAAEDRVHRKNS